MFTTIQKFYPGERGDTRTPRSPSGATSLSSPARRTAASTISSMASRGTCATRCPTPRSSRSRALQSSWRAWSCADRACERRARSDRTGNDRPRDLKLHQPLPVQAGMSICPTAPPGHWKPTVASSPKAGRPTSASARRPAPRTRPVQRVPGGLALPCGRQARTAPQHTPGMDTWRDLFVGASGGRRTSTHMRDSTPAQCSVTDGRNFNSYCTRLVVELNGIDTHTR